jgi:hypothetical protein
MERQLGTMVCLLIDGYVLYVEPRSFRLVSFLASDSKRSLISTGFSPRHRQQGPHLTEAALPHTLTAPLQRENNFVPECNAGFALLIIQRTNSKPGYAAGS